MDKNIKSGFSSDVLSFAEVRGVRNKVSGYQAPKVRASAKKNTFWRTSDIPASWRVETLTEGGIFFVEFYKETELILTGQKPFTFSTMSE